MKIKIDQLGAADICLFKELILLFKDVFKMKNFSIPEDQHINNLLAKSNFLVFIALQDEKVVGGLTAYVLDQYYSVKPLAYIFDLAVKQSLHRNGIGKQLITSFNTYCEKLNFEGVFVQADIVDDYVLDFYRSTNPSEEEQVIHFDYTFQ